jgi:hypothetical protein
MYPPDKFVSANAWGTYRVSPAFVQAEMPSMCRPIPNAHRPKAADNDVTVDGVAVTDDVSRRRFPTMGLGELGSVVRS